MKIPMDRAIDIARDNLEELGTVTEWADIMGYTSAKYFSRVFRNHYKVRPKQALINLKVARFKWLIKEDPNISCFELALEIGLRDEKALNKFIVRHTGKAPRKCKNGE
jgi:transcriptional regulator GlxA family with amidase domain